AVKPTHPDALLARAARRFAFGRETSRPSPREEETMTIPESVRHLVASAPRSHLTTLNSDGSPQVTVVWVAIEDDEIVSAHLDLHHKIKNIRRDPRVAVSLLAPSKNAIGLQEYLVVYGEARVTEGGAVPLLQRLARIYM